MRVAAQNSHLNGLNKTMVIENKLSVQRTIIAMFGLLDAVAFVSAVPAIVRQTYFLFLPPPMTLTVWRVTAAIQLALRLSYAVSAFAFLRQRPWAFIIYYAQVPFRLYFLSVALGIVFLGNTQWQALALLYTSGRPGYPIVTLVLMAEGLRFVATAAIHMARSMDRRLALVITAILLASAISASIFAAREELYSRDRIQCTRERSVARCFVKYLQYQPDAWPREWADLKYRGWVNADECIAVWSKCVDVDWSVSRRDFLEAPSNAIPELIRIRDEKAYARADTRVPPYKRAPKPNRMVWDHLNGTRTGQSGPRD